MGKVENMNRMPVALDVVEKPAEETDQRVVDEYTYLLGRPTLKEFLDFVEAEVVDGRSADRRALIEEWTSANNYIRILEEKEAGWADNPKIGGLAPHHSGLLRRSVKEENITLKLTLTLSSSLVLASTECSR